MKVYEFYNPVDDGNETALKHLSADEYYVRPTNGVCPKIETSQVDAYLSNFAVATHLDGRIANEVLLAINSLFENYKSYERHLIWRWRRNEHYKEFAESAKLGNPYRVREIYADGDIYEVVVDTAGKDWIVTIKGNLTDDWTLEKVGVVAF